jgi:hypothetical protein
MAAENPFWGEERIANELLVKLGIRVSPRTVGKYMPKRPPGQPRGDQRWSTFLKNHAKAILACDFFVAVTATFRMLYVFVVIEHGTRRLAHVSATAHPSADWTLQRLREVVGEDGGHQYLIHDRDKIFAKHLDDSADRIACWDLAYRIRRGELWQFRNPNPEIDWRRVRSYSRNRFWEACTMSIPSQRRARAGDRSLHHGVATRDLRACVLRRQYSEPVGRRTLSIR